uniref:Uncharacterized protein n=1 Tax=Callorhinchus milii TaxID=7868 RepID=A0A4W3HE42_CALMI
PHKRGNPAVTPTHTLGSSPSLGSRQPAPKTLWNWIRRGRPSGREGKRKCTFNFQTQIFPCTCGSVIVGNQDSQHLFGCSVSSSALR